MATVETEGKYTILVGGTGAGCVAEIDGIRFLEARISIVGRVIQFGIPAFEVVP